ncbi:MAG TPA: uroporphyrinogen decarboxylase, partial [Methylocella sp.]|nr:uroporphyrinogen decarboxylase [Methylocella sp.]
MPPSQPHMAKPLLNVLDGQVLFPPPVWLMRQAGRYLPEYRELRAKAESFLGFCYAPSLAAEATLQPIRRFSLDAAILFSDILVVPDKLGQEVHFESGEGPKLTPILNARDFAKLAETIDQDCFSPILETISRVKAQLPESVAFIGFCGAPWTLACYMIAGQSTPDQAPARLLAYRDPKLLQALIDRLVRVSIDYLAWQIEAGAEAVQIFDSWAGVLPASELEQWCVAPVAAIIAGLRQRHPSARVIGFPRGVGAALKPYAECMQLTALGLDPTIDPQWAARAFEPHLVLQGNL